MTYDVLSSDLYEENENKESHRHSSSKKVPDKAKKKLNPLYIHIVILLLIFIPLIIYVVSDFDLGFKEKEMKTVFTLVGDIDNFSKNYVGDLLIKSSEFEVDTISGKYYDSSKDIVIKNFNGVIYEKNLSIIFEGVASNLTYGKNLIKLRDTQFKVTSNKKTTLNLFFSNIDLNFNQGRFILGSDLNYEFENSKIIIKNYNTSISFDGTYSFSGVLDEFSLISLDNRLNINFKENMINKTN